MEKQSPIVLFTVSVYSYTVSFFPKDKVSPIIESERSGRACRMKS